MAGKNSQRNRKRKNSRVATVKKQSPEQVARLEFAKQKMQELDAERRENAIPFKMTTRQMKTGDSATPLEDLKKDYSDLFLADFELNGTSHRWVCERKNHFDIFPDSDEDIDEVSMLALYSDAVKLICEVVNDPLITPEDLKELPTTLVTRIARGISDEIMPAYTEEPNVKVIGEDEDTEDTEEAEADGTEET